MVLIMGEANSPQNIILFTRGTKGDLYPFLTIGRGFKEKHCDVTLISNFCYESYGRQEQFDFVALDDEESFEILNNTPEFHTNFPLKLKLYKEHIISKLYREVGIIESKIIDRNSVILAHSNDYISPLLAAERCNVPVYLCMLAPSFAYGFSLIEAALDSLSAELNDVRRELNLTPVHNWKEWLASFDLCFAFWPNWFSGDELSVLPNIRHIGFLSIESVEERPLQKRVIEFVDNNKITILLTHGTSRPFSDDYFKCVIRASQKLNCNLIISTPFKELLPEVLPKNVIWEDFCPFHELLPYVNLIIHHGGIGTVRESIANSVPQLIIGQGFDRQHNGKVVRNLQLGDWASPKQLSEDILSTKIIGLLENKEITFKCASYKSDLYNSTSLELFYETVLAGMSCGTENYTNKISARKSIISNPGLEREDNRVSSSFSNRMTITAPSDDQILNDTTLKKRELLLKLLKNKKALRST